MPQSPVYDVIGVPLDKVVANDYNPNKVAPPEMELLERSIWEDGYTQPVVACRQPGTEEEEARRAAIMERRAKLKEELASIDAELSQHIATSSEKYIVVDGFHRRDTMRRSSRIYQREGGILPVVGLEKDLQNRMASTIRHNRARGSHQIDLMRNIVAELVTAGMSDRWIMKQIGMCADELLRLKQTSGLAALFADREFSRAWSPEEE